MIREDHPRLCGEKFCPVTTLRLIIGSPPPMRGKESKVQKSDGIRRITPAYAGKRFFRCSAMHHRRDHPRLCGEKVGYLLIADIHRGSPPPMRGKGRLRFSGFGASGITPAYAGKSTSFRQLPYSCQDHPRLCGEKFSNFHSLEFAPGSPPPMRGKVKQMCNFFRIP